MEITGITSANIEIVPAEELRHIPDSVFALAFEIGDDWELAGHVNEHGFLVTTWDSIESAEAARVLLPDHDLWEVVGLLFLMEDDADEGIEPALQFQPVAADH